MVSNQKISWSGTKRSNGNDEEDEATMFRTTRLPGIVTPLDFTRAVGIDAFSVPAKIEDRQTYEERHPKSTLHPDHVSPDMKRPVLMSSDIPHSARVLACSRRPHGTSWSESSG